MLAKDFTETEIQQILKDYIIQKFMYGAKAVLEDDWLLIEEGTINSLGIITLISFIGEQFGISIASEEIVLDNFKDVNSIKSLVVSKIKASTQPAIIQKGTERKLLSVVPVKPSGYKRPFFYVHGLGGHGSAPTLAQYLHSERPFYGLQAVGLDGEKAPYTRIEDMVAHYIQEIQTVQPEGSYLLGGLCIGGNIALEIAQQLRKCGQQVLLVVMADSPNPLWTEEERIELANWLSCQKSSRRKELINSGFSLKQIENIFRVQDANSQLIASHIPQVYSGKVVYLSAWETIEFLDEMTMQRVRYRLDPMQPNGWNSWVVGGIELHKVPGSHMTFFKEPHIRVFAEKLNACLEEVDGVLLPERK